jgi:hypothetical protein
MPEPTNDVAPPAPSSYGIKDGNGTNKIEVVGSCIGHQQGEYLCSEPGNYIKWNKYFGIMDFDISSTFRADRIEITGLSFVLWSEQFRAHIGLDGDGGQLFYEGDSWGGPELVGRSPLVAGQSHSIRLIRRTGVLSVFFDGVLIKGMDVLSLPVVITAVGWRPHRNVVRVESLELQESSKVGCWSSQLNGQYVQEGHGPSDECYDFATAQTKCEEAADCHAIATQINLCNGLYRVTHGGPTMTSFDDWEAFNLWAFRLDRTCGTLQAASTIAATTSTATIGTSTTTTIVVCDAEEVNPPELARTYSSVWGKDDLGKDLHAQSMLDSPQAWSAITNRVGQWMIMDLGFTGMVQGVVTQARHDNNQHVTSFAVQYSSDLSTWKNISGTHGGATSSDKRQAMFPSLVEARYVKLVVKSWTSHVSMRAGLLVCKARVRRIEGNSAVPLAPVLFHMLDPFNITDNYMGHRITQLCWDNVQNAQRCCGDLGNTPSSTENCFDKFFTRDRC